MTQQLIPINRKTLLANLSALAGRYPDEYNARKIISYVSNSTTGDTLLVDRELTVPEIPGDYTFRFAIEDKDGLSELPDVYRYILEDKKEKEVPIEEAHHNEPTAIMMATINNLVNRMELNYRENLTLIKDMSETHSREMGEAYKTIEKERAKITKEYDTLVEERISNAKNAGNTIAEAMKKAAENMPTHTPSMERPGFLERFGDKLMEESSPLGLLQFAVGVYNASTGKEIDMSQFVSDEIQDGEVVSDGHRGN